MEVMPFLKLYKSTIANSLFSCKHIFFKDILDFIVCLIIKIKMTINFLDIMYNKQLIKLFIWSQCTPPNKCCQLPCLVKIINLALF